jgi:hypothetical protein
MGNRSTCGGPSTGTATPRPHRPRPPRRHDRRAAPGRPGRHRPHRGHSPVVTAAGNVAEHSASPSPSPSPSPMPRPRPRPRHRGRAAAGRNPGPATPSPVKKSPRAGSTRPPQLDWPTGRVEAVARRRVNRRSGRRLPHGWPAWR